MAGNILDLIGNTPLVELKRLNPNPRVTILAKLEYLNPGGSIKDRAALYMIEEGERCGQLTPAKTVIEATSGNTGIGLALVCAVKGYRLVLAMAETASIERQKILRARGAELLLTPGHLGTDGAIEEVYRLARENPDKYFMTDQFNNPANWKAHYHGTAMEIWRQTQGAVTAVVATMGTTGTLMGLSRRLKELNSGVEIIGVEPYLGHKIQGLKNMKESYRPEIYQRELLDTKVHVEDEEAFETSRRLAADEGLLVGMSSGAAVAAACRLAETMDSGLMVVLLPDGGERYLSTSLFVQRKITGLKLFNAASRRKETFEPRADNKVTLFSNGPSTLGHLDLAEARRLVFTDLLRRYLAYSGLEVEHIMTVNDLDDHTLDGAEAAGLQPEQFAARNLARFRSELETLGVIPADTYLFAGQHVEQMVEVANRLVAKGFAYEKMRSLYFDISRSDGYGQLSGIDVDKVRPGATVEVDRFVKDNPRDFALFKRVNLRDLKKGRYFKTPWGSARPTWSLQCATMALEFFKAGCDIHAGGRGQLFPHHENENAIAQALTRRPLARFWVYCEAVQSVENHSGDLQLPASIKQLLEQGWQGREIRFWLLASHYHKPLSFSRERMLNARRSLQRLDDFLTGLQTWPGGQHWDGLDQLLYDLKSGFTAALDDDLNMSAALATVFKAVKTINGRISAGLISRPQADKTVAVFRELDKVLNVFAPDNLAANHQIKELLQQRQEARKAGNWRLADQIRDKLLAMGVVVRDPKTG